MSTKAITSNRIAATFADPELRAAKDQKRARRTQRRDERQVKADRLRREFQRRAAASVQSVDEASHYLVIHNGALLATFLSADDAMLFEAELADLDVARHAEGASCEVRDRRGRKLGGYAIAGGQLLAMVEDRQFDRRFRCGRPRSSYRG